MDFIAKRPKYDRSVFRFGPMTITDMKEEMENGDNTYAEKKWFLYKYRRGGDPRLNSIKILLRVFVHDAY